MLVPSSASQRTVLTRHSLRLCLKEMKICIKIICIYQTLKSALYILEIAHTTNDHSLTKSLTEKKNVMQMRMYKAINATCALKIAPVHLAGLSSSLEPAECLNMLKQSPRWRFFAHEWIDEISKATRIKTRSSAGRTQCWVQKTFMSQRIVSQALIM